MIFNSTESHHATSMTEDVLTPPNSSRLGAAVPVKIMAAPDATVDHQPPLRPQTTLAIRRPENPPRNRQGDICCDHEECEGKEVIFRRKCEWDKHMDRHERPYKCDHPNCQNSQGFTYSGGLLRHQREVHRWYQTTKSRIFCPFQGCSRSSSGEGFSRKENLEEHKRRRHSEQMPSIPVDGEQPTRKRKRPPTPVPSDYGGKIDEVEQDEISEVAPDTVDATNALPDIVTEDHPIVKKLRKDLQQMQEDMHRIIRDNHMLRTQLAQYYNVLQTFPPQIYQVGTGPQTNHGLLSPQSVNHQYLETGGMMGHGMPNMSDMPDSAYKK